MMIRIILVSLFTLILVACGGGGGGSSDNSVEEVEVSLQTVTVDKPSYMTGSESLKIVSPMTGETYLDQAEQVDLMQYGSDEVLMILDEDEDIALLGYANGANDRQSLTSESTAVALLAANPSLVSHSKVDPSRFKDSIVGLAEVQALVLAVDTTPKWSRFEDESFNHAYIAAFKKVTQLISDGSLIFKLSSKRAKKEGVASKIDPTHIEQVENELGYPISGVFLEADGESGTFDLEPATTIKIFNDKSRYVYIVVGTGPHDHGVQSFMVGPNSKVEIKEVYDTELFSEKLPVEINGVGIGNYVYAFGPGPGVLLNFTGNDEKYYFQASLASLAEFYFLPAISAFSKVPKACFSNLILPFTGGRPILDPKITQAGFDRYKGDLLSGNYLGAGTTMFASLSIDFSNDIYQCVIDYTKKIVKKDIKSGTIKIIEIYTKKSLGLLTDLMKLNSFLDSLTKFDDDFLKTVDVSPKSTYWLISNENLKSAEKVVFSAKTSIDFPRESLQASDYKYGFSGDCPEGTICKHFGFPRGQGFEVDFEVLCENWNDYEYCRNLVIDTANKKIIGGTKNSPLVNENSGFLNGSKDSWTYSTSIEKATYKGVISASDIDGAYADYDFILQLEEAKPELHIYVDGKEHEDGMDYTFECVGDKPVEMTVSLENRGFGELYLEEKNLGSKGEGWSVESEFSPVTLGYLENVKVKLRNTCDSSKVDSSDIWNVTYGDEEASEYNQGVGFKVAVSDSRFVMHGFNDGQVITKNTLGLSFSSSLEGFWKYGVEIEIDGVPLGCADLTDIKCHDYYSGYNNAVHISSVSDGEHTLVATYTHADVFFSAERTFTKSCPSATISIDELCGANSGSGVIGSLLDFEGTATSYYFVKFVGDASSSAKYYYPTYNGATYLGIDVRQETSSWGIGAGGFCSGYMFNKTGIEVNLNNGCKWSNTATATR